MSRKREKQRESKAELARQLGDATNDVDADDLRARPRVCEPRLKASLSIARADRGLFSALRGKEGPLHLSLVLFVVDAAGARLARAQRLRGPVGASKGDVALTVSADDGPEKVRYSRPGSFVLLALLTEGDADATGSAAALESGAVRVVVEDVARAVSDTALVRLPAPRGAHFVVGDTVLASGATVRFSAGAVAAVPAAHRVSDDFALPLNSADGKLQATLTVSLRV
jgi:hypothetical protein